MPPRKKSVTAVLVNWLGGGGQKPRKIVGMHDFSAVHITTVECCLPCLGNTSTSNIQIIFACRVHILFAFRCKPGLWATDCILQSFNWYWITLHTHTGFIEIGFIACPSSDFYQSFWDNHFIPQFDCKSRSLHDFADFFILIQLFILLVPVKCTNSHKIRCDPWCHTFFKLIQLGTLFENIVHETQPPTNR